MNSKPHVIIIMADQLRMDCVGGPMMPNINRLLEESVAFNRAYCAAPLCVPARGSFFTGKYPNETGSIINPWEKLDASHGYVKEGIANLYQLLEQDWDSWHTGKQHLLTEDRFDQSPDSNTKWNSLENGYNTYLKEHGKRKPGGKAFTGMLPELVSGRTSKVKRYSIPTTGCYEEGVDYFYDGYISKTSLEAIRERDRSKPLLLNAMHLAPHPPLDVPEPWYSKVKLEDVTLPDNVGKWGSNQSPLQLYNLPGVLGSRYTREDWADIWPVYLGLVGLLDDCVGKLIQELKDQGMYDNSLILFTSDHGEMLGSHCLWQKCCMYEESVRTPLMIKFPEGFKPAINQSNVLVSAIDIFPTLCDYLEVDIPNPVTGLSLMPIIRGEADSLSRERLFIQYDGNGARGNFQRCVVEGDHKLIVDLFKDELFIELYHVTEDGQEMINRAFDEDQEETVRHLLDKLRDHMQNTGDMLTIAANSYDTFIEQYKPLASMK